MSLSVAHCIICHSAGGVGFCLQTGSWFKGDNDTVTELNYWGSIRFCSVTGFCCGVLWIFCGWTDFVAPCLWMVVDWDWDVFSALNWMGCNQRTAKRTVQFQQIQSEREKARGWSKKSLNATEVATELCVLSHFDAGEFLSLKSVSLIFIAAATTEEFFAHKRSILVQWNVFLHILVFTG